MGSRNGLNVLTMRTKFPPGRKGAEPQQENSLGLILGVRSQNPLTRRHLAVPTPYPILSTAWFRGRSFAGLKHPEPPFRMREIGRGSLLSMKESPRPGSGAAVQVLVVTGCQRTAALRGRLGVLITQ